ncbi:unnamed protein product [Periconia digitata]|uniref:Uncharacterized protein n=1 Tax=Periconia digitata TaxID=1303443 RepID=A0A9W4U254_9PLEO|nr:unnamed protein product [Periconia digitata]
MTSEVRVENGDIARGIKRPASWSQSMQDGDDEHHTQNLQVTRGFYDLQESAPLVCFGTLREIPIQVRYDPVASMAKDRKTDELVILNIIQLKETFWVTIGDGEPFGCFTTKMAEGLSRLRSLTHACSECQGIEYDGVVKFAAITDASESLNRSKFHTNLIVDINLYGHAHSAKAAGDALASSQLFLQFPTSDSRGLVYDNPQHLKLPGLADVHYLRHLDTLMEESIEERVQEASRTDIEAILDHMPQHGFLRELSADARISTELVKHQKEALDFMTRRELGSLPSSMSFWRSHSSENKASFYENVITHTRNNVPEEPLGGILADDMGLGKTLTSLAVIVGSLDRALDFARERTGEPIDTWHKTVPSKATLVVVPSSLLLDSWATEIERHIQRNTIRFYRYHGSSKRIEISDLLRCDIVLTTYATISSEFCRGQSMINRISWYRIVLDEAHTIRNAATKQFRAIHSITSHIRWCLTGTPIQNSLEDLGALVEFLRVPILDDRKTFRNHIIAPVLAGKSVRFRNLRKLLEILCLRRTKSLLNLPEPTTHTHMLDLSAPEREAYQDFGDSCRHAIDLAISGHSLKKANHHIIQTILGMRLFCNEGPKAFKGKKSLNGLPSDPDHALSYLQTCGKATCAQCHCEVQSMYHSDDRSSATLTVCEHLICGDCLPIYETDLNNDTKEGRAICPICGRRWARDSFFIGSAQDPADTPTSPEEMPSKLKLLLENLQTQGPDDKCVVFSFWKRTLDLVATGLEALNVPFLRIHGSIPSAKRVKILVEFEQSTSARILLVTFGTGGVGINKLMVANCIHILEPQWNPSVESQAIGRVLRLGQERSVRIVRYIARGTVEEAVQSQQLRKLQLARGGFGLAFKDDDTSQRVSEIMKLLCPVGVPNVSNMSSSPSLPLYLHRRNLHQSHYPSASKCLQLSLEASKLIGGLPARVPFRIRTCFLVVFVVCLYGKTQELHQHFLLHFFLLLVEVLRALYKHEYEYEWDCDWPVDCASPLVERWVLVDLEHCTQTCNWTVHQSDSSLTGYHVQDYDDTKQHSIAQPKTLPLN